MIAETIIEIHKNGDVVITFWGVLLYLLLLVAIAR